ncbi:hypothetical protein [Schleiferia thermophila]|jgi:hypothetical protein|uniref:Uncharacterized protein n=1 Tax=Schleiferia thermophila TaxID=884107 RepID=A0A369A3I5_9FLAO|nr:hypothetical protein [Schleiferia thermophila]RCX03765.1 hypothetical protein DES35_102220 [Schleiferia thermophila]
MFKMSGRALFCLLLIISSCNKDKFDFGKLKEIELTPEIWIPFGEVSLSLKDIKQDTSIVSVDEDGFISIIIEKDSMIRTSLSKAMLIPEQDTNFLAVVKGQSVQTDVSVNVFNQAEYKKIYFDTLVISWMLPVGTPPGTRINISFVNSGHQNGNLDFELDNTTHQEGEFHTSVFYNGFIDLSKNNSTFNVVQLSGNLLQTAPWVPNGTPIPFTLHVSKLKVAGIEGYAGNTTIDLPIFNNQLNIRGLEKFSQGIIFKNPSLKLNIFNQSGLELAFNPKINGANPREGEVISLEVPIINVAKSPSPGQAFTTQITLDKNNSNLPDMLNNLPDYLTASGFLILNPSGNQNNFLFQNNLLIVNGTLEIPMEFSASNLFFENEISNFKFWNSENRTPEYVEFELNSQNLFPFHLKLSLVFEDSLTSNVIRAYEVDILKAAPIDGNGRVVNPSNHQARLTLSENDLNDVNRANKLKLQVRINTPNNGNDFVKIYDSYRFTSRISGRAKLKIQPLK